MDDLIEINQELEDINFDPDLKLHNLCESGELDEVENFLKYNKDYKINKVDSKGNIALHIACQRNFCGFKEDIVKILIYHGSNINFQNNDGETPLFVTTNPEILKILIENRANLLLRDKFGTNVLNKNCRDGNFKNVEIILNHVDPFLINIPDNSGETSIHYACKSGSENIVKLLLKYDADVNVQNNKGNTPLHIACLLKIPEMVDILLNYNSDINIQNQEGDLPMHLMLKRLVWDQEVKHVDTVYQIIQIFYKHQYNRNTISGYISNSFNKTHKSISKLTKNILS